MSEVQQPVAAVAEPVVADPVASTAETAAIEPLAPTTDTAAVSDAAPATEAAPAAAAVDEPAAAAAPVTEPVKAEEPAAATTADKVIEPITEGQLAYKGPGLVSSLIPSKKEFWLNDAAVTRAHLDLYLRGEKAELSHPVAAWASQTGKGLLFFNKKGDLNHERPSSILALYDALDLKKSSPHEITFKLYSHQHTLKAASDSERDGWYVSIEKAIELGKAQKETVVESPSYKTELEALGKPTSSTPAIAGAAATGSVVAAGVAASEHTKTSEAAKDDVATPTPAPVEETSAKKAPKSRSTSRGVFNRLKLKKDELETKKEEKKEEKAEKEDEPSSEATPALVAGGAALDAPSTADRVFAAPVVEATPETTAETVPATDAAKVEEKPKVSKRNSIFGKLQGGWVKSPSKEKSEKDAELKPEVPVMDAGVSETAPQIPEPTATEPVTEVVPPVSETTEPTTESKPAEAAKEQLDAVSPSTQKSGFLSGLFPKRNRSVSPSTPVTEAPKEETSAVPTEATPAVEPTTEEPAAPVVAAETPAAAEAEKTVEEPAKTETTSSANKRQSMLGSLGRRASKALNRMQAPKKENVAPATSEAAPEEAAATEATPAAEAPVADAETKTTEAAPQSSIGDVVPEAVHVGQPQTPVVTASA